MISATCSTPVLVLILVFFVSDIDAKWFAKPDSCKKPGGGDGSCINIYNCQPITELLMSAPKPLSQQMRELLVSYQCDTEEGTVKVCCPDGPIKIEGGPTNITGGPTNITNDDSVSTGPPDVTNHKNIKLLDLTSCGPMQLNERLLNGNLSTIFEFPWMALLSYKLKDDQYFKCGGTLINDRYILTAAHCITMLSKYSLLGVRLGEHDISKKIDCETHLKGNVDCSDPVQDLAVEEVIPHPNFNPRALTNDIGLLRLAVPADISRESVRPICLPVTEEVRNKELKKVIVTDWGRTVNASRSDILLKIHIPVIDAVTCNKAYAPAIYITHRQMCAGGTSAGDACESNSGGPLQVLGVMNQDVRYIQYGVVSFGPLLCNNIKHHPGVYTKIIYYLDWILDNMKP